MEVQEIRINNIAYSVAVYDNILMIANQATAMHLPIKSLMFEDEYKWLVTRDSSVRVHLNDVYEQVKALVEMNNKL